MKAQMFYISLLSVFLSFYGTAFAGPTINQLPPGMMPLSGTEEVPIYQGGLTKKAPVSALGLMITQRPPLPSDDSTKGYAVGAYWLNQATGILYQAQDVTQSAAIWTPMPYQASSGSDSGLPGDRVTGAAGLYGTVLLTQGYSGNAFTVERASDSTTQAIGFTGQFVGAQANWALVDEFCAGTTCGVSTLNDQSGNSCNLTQSTFANMPLIQGHALNGIRTITFPGGASGFAAFWVAATGCPSGVATNALSVVYAGRLKSVDTGGFAEIGTGSSSLILANLAGSSTALQSLWTFANDCCGHTENLYSESDPAITILSSGASSRTWWVNNSTKTNSSSLGTTSLTGFRLGAPDNSNYQGGMQELVAAAVYASALSAANAAIWQDAAFRNFNIVPHTCDRIVGVGDSITTGEKTGVDFSWPELLAGMLHTPVKVFNAGIPGKTAASSLTDNPSFQYASPLYQAGCHNIAVLLLGRNDISASTPTATILVDLEAIGQDLQALGWTVIVSTVTPSTGDGTDTARQALNAAIVANWPSFANGLANPGADPVIGPYAAASNATYYVDGTHPTALGQTYLAKDIYMAVSSFLQ